MTCHPYERESYELRKTIACRALGVKSKKRICLEDTNPMTEKAVH